MFTKQNQLSAALLAAILVCGSSVIHAQVVDVPGSWEDEQSIDETLEALLGPVWQPVYFTERDGKGISTLSHIYKQEPPGAQGDFRPPSTEPVIKPGPGPITPVKPGPGPEPDPEPEPEPVADQKPKPGDEPDQQQNQPCPIIIFDPNCFGP